MSNRTLNWLLSILAGILIVGLPATVGLAWNNQQRLVRVETQVTDILFLLQHERNLVR